MTIPSTVTPTVARLSSRIGARIDGVRPSGGAINAAHPSSLPESPNAYRTCPAADMSARPVNPAETAQAAHFEAMLQIELLQLRGLMTSMTPCWAEEGTDQHRPPAALTQLGARLREVDRLLSALRDRFLHKPLVDEPAERG